MTPLAPTRNNVNSLQKSFLLPLLAISLFATNGCESTGGSARTPLESTIGDWTLTQLAGDDGARLPANETARPTLSIDGDGLVSGFSGVNRYTGSLSLDALAQGQFSLGPVATTRMAGPPEAMDLESQFLETLSRVDAYGVEGDVLVLEGAGEGLLHFLKTAR